MKKRLQDFGKITVMLLASLFIFSACEGPTGPPGRDGQDGAETIWKIADFTVKSNQWEWNEDDKTYRFIGDLPALNEDFYEDGGILGFVYLGTQGVDERLFPLEFKGDTNNPVLIQYNVSLDLNRTVEFIFQWHSKAKQQPPLYNFKIVMLY
ncbi:hypothetical protein [Dysgonomonas sp. 520]|uniref:hypothetical protein n=1 Tax=Dysgonomonas sp. 520 TaxID=2302931 RepID=UPI0013D3E20E|nr:hypothetical protein [Dysgonomonas sp. 520]NDW08344.1 hypothetical protein [Dysgonomonas sp. 520]